MSSIHVRASRGFGMAEALIALLISAIMLTGLLALHWQLYARHALAYQRFVVNFAVADLLQRWRLNLPAAAAYREGLQQVVPVSATDPCRLQPCSVNERARADVMNFALALQAELVSPQWQIKPCQHAPGECLWVSWQGYAVQDCSAHKRSIQPCLMVNTP